MKRRIIIIDKEKCTGCGICATACHEGAIEIIDGKAELVRENFCDGLGDCLPGCPVGAITFEEREAPAYDEQAVLKAKEAKKNEHKILLGGPVAKNLLKPTNMVSATPKVVVAASPVTKKLFDPKKIVDEECHLNNWPIQIKLAPTTADFYDGCDLLIAADCSGFAYPAFHKDFIQNRVTLIGCSKLDNIDYCEKLTAILASNEIESILVVRMEVPCCGGLARMVNKALENCGKDIPFKVITISSDGMIL